MAGFVYGLGEPRPQHNVRSNILMEAPYYGYGLCYNPGVQNVEGFPRQFGIVNDLGVGGNVNCQPAQMQRQMYCHNSNSGSASWVQVGQNPNDNYGGTRAIQGEVVQRGCFNGRAKGARIHGHYSVSADIN